MDKRHEPINPDSESLGTCKHCNRKIFRADPDFAWYHDNGDYGSASYLCPGEKD